MLKPMKPKQTFPNNTILWILVGVLVIGGIAAIVSAFSGGGKNAEDEVNAVYTNAAATLAIQQMTLQAASPSVTPTVATPTGTVTFTPQPLATIPTSQGISTSSSSGGSTSGAVGCNNSVFVSDVTVPDDTVMTPGQTFTKTWKLQNTGSCPWTTSFKVSFVSGNAMGGTATALTTTVQPGQSGDISVAMTAPASTGDATGYWILTTDGGQNFGSSFYVKIKVGSTTSGTTTVTPTVTATGVVATPVPINNPTFNGLVCTPDTSAPVKYKHTGTLAWEDLSNNETGFKIYLNGSLLTTTAADVKTLAIDSAFLDAGSVTYGIEAFNSGGSAPVKVVSITCQ